MAGELEWTGDGTEKPKAPKDSKPPKEETPKDPKPPKK